MKQLKKLERVYMKLLDQAVAEGNQKPGRKATCELRKLPIWEEVKEFLSHAKYQQFEQLFAGKICTECAVYWTSPQQQGICENCFSGDPKSYRKLRYNRGSKQRKETNLLKYGSINPPVSEATIEQRKQTCQTKYGGNAPTCSSEVLEKRKQNEIAKTGYENSTQRPEVIERVSAKLRAKTPEEWGAIVQSREQTNLNEHGHINGRWGKSGKSKADETWEARTQEQNTESQSKRELTMQANPAYNGHSHAMRDPEFKEQLRQKNGFVSSFELPETHEKSKKTLKKRYKVTNPGQLPDHKDKIRATTLKKSGGKYEFPMQDPEVFRKAMSTGSKIIEVAIEDHMYKVQGNSEARLVRKLVERFGHKKVVTQFDEHFSDPDPSEANWHIDFLIQGEFYIECKSTWTLYGRENWLATNRRKNKDCPNVKWVVEHRPNQFIVLPETWYKIKNIKHFVEKEMRKKFG